MMISNDMIMMIMIMIMIMMMNSNDINNINENNVINDGNELMMCVKWIM